MRGRRPARERRWAGPQSGASLIEVLVAVVIMGIAFSVVVGGVGAAIIGADVQKQQAGADVVVRTAAETVLDPVKAPYVPCATPASTGYTAPLPAGATITAVSYWDKEENRFEAAAPGTCAATPPADTGLQLIALSATSAGGGRTSTETLEVVKRR